VTDAEFAAVGARLRELWAAMGETAPQTARLGRLYEEVRTLEERLRRAGIDPRGVPDFDADSTPKSES
jgi:hypothetical protein